MWCEIVQNIKNLVPGKIVKIDFHKRSWMYRTAAGTVKSVYEYDGDYTVVMTDWVDTYLPNRIHKKYILKFRTNLSEYEKENWEYKTIIHRGSQASLKRVATLVKKSKQESIRKYYDELAKLQDEIKEYKSNIKEDSKLIKTLERKFNV